MKETVQKQEERVIRDNAIPNDNTSTVQLIRSSSPMEYPTLLETDPNPTLTEEEEGAKATTLREVASSRATERMFMADGVVIFGVSEVHCV
jgi:hypothetical protein